MYADEDSKQGNSMQDAVLPRMYLFEVVVKYCFNFLKGIPSFHIILVYGNHDSFKNVSIDIINKRMKYGYYVNFILFIRCFNT